MPYPNKWVTEVSRDEISTKFLGWEPEVQQMLEVRTPADHLQIYADIAPDVDFSALTILRDGRSTLSTAFPLPCQALATSSGKPYLPNVME